LQASFCSLAFIASMNAAKRYLYQCYLAIEVIGAIRSRAGCTIYSWSGRAAVQ
jgi:hypothetical protein